MLKYEIPEMSMSAFSSYKKINILFFDFKLKVPRSHAFIQPIFFKKQHRRPVEQRTFVVLGKSLKMNTVTIGSLTLIYETFFNRCYTLNVFCGDSNISSVNFFIVSLFPIGL